MDTGGFVVPAVLDAKAREVIDRVDADRLLATQRALARFGALPGGGIAREALSVADLEARGWLCSLFPQPGYAWSIDSAANSFLRRSGRDDTLAPVVTGSHVDTQPVGGWLDGAYGICAGIEVLRALDDAELVTRRPIELAVWTNEEGSRFSPGAMGSSAFSDPSRLASYLQVRDAAGVSFEHARGLALGAASVPKRVDLGHPVAAYVEAHIEQGPVLERGGHDLGIVTGIQGVRWLEVSLAGDSGHAGTTPLALRRDPLLAAARLIARLADEAIGIGDEALRFTVGRLQVNPGSINTIAGSAAFTIDLRHPDDRVLDMYAATIREIVGAAHGRCDVEIRTLFERPRTWFDTSIVDLVEAAAGLAHARPLRLQSGAFHDAMYLAEICPTAMLFVPSIGGVSHHPAEDTTPGDLVTGARVLAGTLTTLANA